MRDHWRGFVDEQVRRYLDCGLFENGFDAIVSLESLPLVYVVDSAVITDAVIRLYDERYPIE